MPRKMVNVKQVIFMIILFFLLQLTTIIVFYCSSRSVGSSTDMFLLVENRINKGLSIIIGAGYPEGPELKPGYLIKLVLNQLFRGEKVKRRRITELLSQSFFCRREEFLRQWWMRDRSDKGPKKSPFLPERWTVCVRAMCVPSLGTCSSQSSWFPPPTNQAGWRHSGLGWSVKVSANPPKKSTFNRI